MGAAPAADGLSRTCPGHSLPWERCALTSHGRVLPPRAGRRGSRRRGRPRGEHYGRVVSSDSEPVPFEAYQEGVYLHGTKAVLGIGELLEAGRESNFEKGRMMNFVYFTATLDAAVWGAELASGDGAGRVYIVEPTGEFHDGELANWVGHSREKKSAMRDGINELKRRGAATIED